MQNEIELDMLSFTMYGDIRFRGNMRLKETASYSAFKIWKYGPNILSNAYIMAIIREYYNALLVIDYFLPKQQRTEVLGLVSTF